MRYGTNENSHLQVAGSGLPRPIYCHNGKLDVVEATGLPLGLFPNAEYDEFTFHAHPGDMFVFFSDGILDARNRAGDMFGRHRVEEIVGEVLGPDSRPIWWWTRFSRPSPNMLPGLRPLTIKP